MPPCGWMASTLAEHTMAVLPPAASARLHGRDATGARLMVIGGAPLDAPRHMWWNFVSSRKERIVQAAHDWEAGRFAPVPGEREFIPFAGAALHGAEPDERGAVPSRHESPCAPAVGMTGLASCWRFLPPGSGYAWFARHRSVNGYAVAAAD
jgi:hypothetical protein